MSILYFQNIFFYVGQYNYSRRSCCFEGNELHTLKLKFLFLRTLYDWISTSHTFFTLDFLEFMDKHFFFFLGFLLRIHPVYWGCVPLRSSVNNFLLLVQKKIHVFYLIKKERVHVHHQSVFVTFSCFCWN